jgi:hypothetical protein
MASNGIKGLYFQGIWWAETEWAISRNLSSVTFEHKGKTRNISDRIVCFSTEMRAGYPQNIIQNYYSLSHLAPPRGMHYEVFFCLLLLAAPRT